MNFTTTVPDSGTVVYVGLNVGIKEHLTGVNINKRLKFGKEVDILGYTFADTIDMALPF